jgi:uncharacterized membrane protein YgdD (TMEM256/DUF423 family)
MQKKYLTWGLIFGMMSVIIGAFGAHALKEHLSSEQQLSFETAVRYQMYHALLLLILSQYKELHSRLVLNLLVAGVMCFSLSIYLLNLRGLLNMDFLSFLGPVTPLGGTLLIAAWGMLLYRAFSLAKQN